MRASGLPVLPLVEDPFVDSEVEEVPLGDHWRVGTEVPVHRTEIANDANVCQASLLGHFASDSCFQRLTGRNSSTGNLQAGLFPRTVLIGVHVDQKATVGPDDVSDDAIRMCQHRRMLPQRNALDQRIWRVWNPDDERRVPHYYTTASARPRGS